MQMYEHKLKICFDWKSNIYIKNKTRKRGMSKEEQGVLQKTRNQTNKLKAPWANCLTALKIAPKVFRCNCLYFIYKTIRKARKPMELAFIMK